MSWWFNLFQTKYPTITPTIKDRLNDGDVVDVAKWFLQSYKSPSSLLTWTDLLELQIALVEKMTGILDEKDQSKKSCNCENCTCGTS